METKTTTTILQMIDPWNDITPPVENSLINARRVDPAARWDLFWGVDGSRNPLLILQHGRGLLKSRRLPKLRGLRVETLPADHRTDERTLIRLTDREQRDIFLRFCRDIVDSTVLARTEEQAIDQFLARTWRWHHLLQGGRDGRLSDREQKGLIGELIVLVRHMLPALGATDAVKSWTGPLGSPHDFEMSHLHIEAKARGSSLPLLNISSEFQLDSSNAATLFLHVTELVIATHGAEDGATLTDFADRARSSIAREDMMAVDLFDHRLAALGFSWTDDYSDKPWLVVGESVYGVREGFPRITPTMFPTGIGNVRYTISLADCKQFLVDVATLRLAASELVDGC